MILKHKILNYELRPVYNTYGEIVRYIYKDEWGDIKELSKKIVENSNDWEKNDRDN